MFKLNIKKKALSLKREGKVEDAKKKILKTSKALKAQVIETKDAQNKFMAHVMKDGIFNPSLDEESDLVLSKEDMHDPTLNLMFTRVEG